MARPPQSIEQLASRYGPTLKYTPPGGWVESGHRSDEKLVKTHCCFCGQQCGIQLRVHENEVVGFEPWEEFPFNRGMLCPKGVKRYLQGSHPDRLLNPLMRTENGFRQATWDEALGTTARRLQEIQAQYGKDSVALLGGALGLLFFPAPGESCPLVVLESMACGTPVLAIGHGPVPELVTKSRGFFVDTADDMIGQIPRLAALDRAAIRRDAVERFDTRRMVDDYLAIYEQATREYAAAGAVPGRR